MVNFRRIIWLLYLLKILFIPETVIAGGSQETKNIHLTFDLIVGELLFQIYGPDASAVDINLYRNIQGFRTSSIRSTNRNGRQYTELVLQADNPDDPLLLERIFTHMLARDCVLRYDADNDTLNLIINNADGMRVNSHNGRELLSPVNTEKPMLMFVWPGDAEIFEVDVSING